MIHVICLGKLLKMCKFHDYHLHEWAEKKKKKQVQNFLQKTISLPSSTFKAEVFERKIAKQEIATQNIQWL